MANIDKVNLLGTSHDITDEAEGSLRSCGISTRKITNASGIVIGINLLRPNPGSGVTNRLPDPVATGFIPTDYFNNYYLQLLRNGCFVTVPHSNYQNSHFDNMSFDYIQSGNPDYGTHTATITLGGDIGFQINDIGYYALLDSNYGNDLFMIVPETITMRVDNYQSGATAYGNVTATLSNTDKVCPIIPYPYTNSFQPVYYVVRAATRRDDLVLTYVKYIVQDGSQITDIEGTAYYSNPKWRIHGANSVGDFSSIPPFSSNICSDFILQTIGNEAE